MNNSGENGLASEEAKDPRFEQAAFGREVAYFVDEDRIGRYLVEKARLDLETAHAALVDVDPTDSQTIAALQLDARVANRVREWLGEAIENGRAAEASLQQEQDEHGR